MLGLLRTFKTFSATYSNPKHTIESIVTELECSPSSDILRGVSVCDHTSVGPFS